MNGGESRCEREGRGAVFLPPAKRLCGTGLGAALKVFLSKCGRRANAVWASV